MKGYEVQEVAYTNEDGKKTIHEGKDVMQLQSFFAEGGKMLMELMPVNTEKPDKKLRHVFKNLSGYFTIWTNNHVDLLGLQQFNMGGPSFVTTFHLVSIENGPPFLPFKKGAYKTLIDPLLISCKGVQSTEIHGFLDINNMELVDKCFDYNRLCAPDYGK
jgi:hypothetical protein